MSKVFRYLGILGLVALPVQAASLSQSQLAGFTECLSASISYQLNHGNTVEKSVQSAVSFCFSRNAK